MSEIRNPIGERIVLVGGIGSALGQNRTITENDLFNSVWRVTLRASNYLRRIGQLLFCPSNAKMDFV